MALRYKEKYVRVRWRGVRRVRRRFLSTFSVSWYPIMRGPHLVRQQPPVPKIFLYPIISYHERAPPRAPAASSTKNLFISYHVIYIRGGMSQAATEKKVTNAERIWAGHRRPRSPPVSVRNLYALRLPKGVGPTAGWRRISKTCHHACGIGM